MVFVHLAQGFEEIEALSTVDILRRADIDVKTISVMPQKTVEGAHGISVVADFMFDEVDYNDCTMIILPGGMPGSSNLYAHAGLCQQILRFHTEGKWLAAICAAPGVVFGQLGILNGKKAVCYPGFEDQMTGAIVQSDPVVVSDRIITSNAPGSVFAFALQIVALLQSSDVAAKVRSGMLLSY